MTALDRCCEVTRNDLAAAHRRVGEVESQNVLLRATVDGLRAELATMTRDRDNWRDSHAKAITGQHRQEPAA